MSYRTRFANVNPKSKIDMTGTLKSFLEEKTFKETLDFFYVCECSMA
ncbi:MAG: hypothetical protein AAF915_02895 [Cyanobacteria bacterium P01_D01_bin.50]